MKRQCIWETVEERVQTFKRLKRNYEFNVKLLEGEEEEVHFRMKNYFETACGKFVEKNALALIFMNATMQKRFQFG